MTPRELADRLERLEAMGKSADELVDELRSVSSAESLWQVADRVVAYPAIMGAIYRRASEIGGGAEDRALGYLALAHVLDGQIDRASSLLGGIWTGSRDPVVLQAWALLAEDSTARINRLREGLRRTPDAIRLWRDLAAESLRASRMDDAREAHLWLISRETSPQEQARLREIAHQHGWIGGV
jgi:hypothetical protein